MIIPLDDDVIDDPDVVIVAPVVDIICAPVVDMFIDPVVVVAIFDPVVDDPVPPAPPVLVVSSQPTATSDAPMPAARTSERPRVEEAFMVRPLTSPS